MFACSITLIFHLLMRTYPPKAGGVLSIPRKPASTGASTEAGGSVIKTPQAGGNTIKSTRYQLSSTPRPAPDMAWQESGAKNKMVKTPQARGKFSIPTKLYHTEMKTDASNPPAPQQVDTPDPLVMTPSVGDNVRDQVKETTKSPNMNHQQAEPSASEQQKADTREVLVKIPRRLTPKEARSPRGSLPKRLAPQKIKRPRMLAHREVRSPGDLLYTYEVCFSGGSTDRRFARQTEARSSGGSLTKRLVYQLSS